MAKSPSYFLVKSEPFKYSWEQLCRDGQTRWDGVRNFEARNNLRAMRVGDLVLFYHSSEGKQIVGVTRVVTAAYPDPTAPGEDWSVVDLAPVVELTTPISLARVKAEPRLAEMALVRKSRISVVPVTATEFGVLLRLSDTKLPAAANLPAPPAGLAAAKASKSAASAKASKSAASAKAAKPAASAKAAKSPTATKASKSAMAAKASKSPAKSQRAAAS